METTPAVIGWDAEGKPLHKEQTAPDPVIGWDASGTPIRKGHEAQPAFDPHDPKISQSLVFSKMFNVPPAKAFDYHDELADQMDQLGVKTGTNSIAQDIKVGSENSIFGLMDRQKLPETLQDPTMLDSFVSGLTTMISDLPFYIGGGIVGGAAGSEVPIVGNIMGASIGSFAAPAIIRKALTEGITRGEVQSFGDLVDRIGNVALEGVKGGTIGAVTHGAGLGTLPVGNALVGAAMTKAQQIAAMTILPAAFEGRLPTAQEFAVNAALFTALHYSAKAFGLGEDTSPKVHRKMLEMYEQNGTHPRDVVAEALAGPKGEDPVDRLNEMSRRAAPQEEAKPEEAEQVTVTEPPPPGLRPAIKVGEDVTAAGEGEQHPDVIERTEGGAKAEEEGNLERGFVDREGNFHTREEAKSWVRQNEPEVAKAWEKVTGDPNAPFHSEDYNEARQQATGIKNAAVNEQRAAMGLSPIESPMRAMDPDNWEVAKEDVDSGRLDPLRIAQSINDHPRGLSPEETNALNYFRSRLSNDHKSAMNEVEKARADNNPEAEARAREKLSDVEDRINTVDQATKKAGTEWGLTGLMRQRMVNEDYSLDRLLQRARVASPNGEVSDAIRDRLESLSNQLEAANKKLEEVQNKQAERESQNVIEKIKKETAKTERKGARAEQRAELKVEFGNLTKQMDKLLSGRVSSNPFFDPELLSVLGKMAKNRVEDGLTRIEDIVDEIHAALTNIGYDVTKRDLRDAISGYGKTIEMSKEAVAVTLREARRQGKLISALEDAEAATLPHRSGLQRDKASDRVRELQRQVKQAMRESGIDVRSAQTPEAQWRTSLESVKTRLRNQINDLTQQIKTGEKSPAREGIVRDEEAKALEKHRDELKAMLKQVTGETKPDKPAAQASLEKQIAEVERRIKENDLALGKQRVGRPETEPIQAMRDKLSSLREQFQKMKDAAKPETDPQRTAIERQIADYEKRIADHDLAPKGTKVSRPETEENTRLRDQLDELKERYQQMKKDAKPVKEKGISAEKRIEMVSKAMEKSIADMERRIAENDITPAQRRAGRPETAEVTALRNRLDGLRETFREIKKAAEPKKTPEQIALQRFKTYTTNRIADMERRLSTGDFTKEPQKQTVLDPEAQALKVKLAQLRDQAQAEIQKQEWAKRSTTEKFLHHFSKWRRGVLLSGIRTFGRLGSAAMSRMGVTPIEELTGGVLSQVPGISKVAERAPFEGKPSISAEAKALAEIFNPDTYRDTWLALKNGNTSLDELYGKKGHGRMAPEALDYIGHVHSMVKVLPKRAEFARRMEIGTQWAIDHNLDIYDPKVQSAITAGAYQEAQRAIFMQDNVVSEAWNMALNYAHNHGAAGKTLEAIGRFMLPIIKVPTNIVGETLQYHPVAGAFQTIQLFRLLFNENKMGRSAMDNLTMHDFDNVMRGLKKGTVGIGLLTIGYALRDSISGYFKPSKDKEFERGTMKIGGVSIPEYLQESPALATVQMGATMGHVWDHYQVKGQSGGLVAGSMYAAGAVVERAPLIDVPGRIVQQTRTPEDTGVFVGSLAASTLVPLGVQQIAKWTDPQPEAKRRAKTPEEAIELALPYLRQNVGEKRKRKGFSIRGME